MTQTAGSENLERLTLFSSQGWTSIVACPPKALQNQAENSRVFFTNTLKPNYIYALVGTTQPQYSKISFAVSSGVIEPEIAAFKVSG